MQLMCMLCDQNNISLDMHVSSICPPKFHLYNSLSRTRSQSSSKSQYFRSSTVASSGPYRHSNALATTPGPISTTSLNMGVFSTRSSYKPVTCNLGKSEVLSNALHSFFVVWKIPKRLSIPCAKQLPIHIWLRQVQK